MTRREIADEIARLKHRVELLESERESTVNPVQSNVPSPYPNPYSIYPLPPLTSGHISPTYFHPSRN